VTLPSEDPNDPALIQVLLPAVLECTPALIYLYICTQIKAERLIVVFSEWLITPLSFNHFIHFHSAWIYSEINAQKIY
jgi:hypothetical protein